jgi:Ca-activated chloride channel family protein
MTRGLAAIVVAMLLVALGACSNDDSTSTADKLGDSTGCVVVDITVSPEKGDLMTSLAQEFNRGGHKLPSGSCVFVRPTAVSSGAAEAALAGTWDTAAYGPRPVIWSPASSSWGGILDQRLQEQGKPAMAPTDAKPFMVTPLVIAMPKPMAQALGWPDTPIGFGDIAKLAQDPNGWASHGHPEWGPFRLGKTNPNFSTSGLSALIAQTYAALGTTRDMSSEDVSNPAVVQTSKAIESSVVHYGDTTLNFLNNWYRADRRDTALTYTSAVAVEEKSIIDYNSGNPDGVLQPGEVPRKPRIPLVAIYPKDGTLYSDSPFYVLDASWVSTTERQAAAVFQTFVLQPSNQQKVLKYGFRPGNPAVKVGAPILPSNGVDPTKPETLLEVPRPPVLSTLLDSWNTERKGARVLLTLDVSGSMGDPASDSSSDTKLDLAKRAAVDALGQFKDDDEVGLRVFSTRLGPSGTEEILDLMPIAPIGPNREQMRQQIEQLVPVAGTPLYSVTQQSYQSMIDSYDPARINAVLLLTDGRNDDGNASDDDQQSAALLASLRKNSSGEDPRPVRIFTIGYGSDADASTLEAIAQASNGAAYSAKDPTTISQVFSQVVSNF